ncbi:hypothetical protein [Lentzea sp. NEAU-D7]|uniref:hypothetical protein n=1 Tax=Lentzea sp. NEAU-D7 TaxID=2994667 RepID=UPI00224A8E20|nr:hypothetical protein [Lentzea sp. NEAU-D7]MCX2950894.1 hypothetical protein [Lentzea sp. NEAU-D7]
MDDSHRGVIGASVVAGFLLVLFCAQGAWLGARFALDLGTSGGYVIGEGFHCGKRTGCSSPHGTFTSDDGEVVREDVRLDGRLEAAPGRGGTVRAYDIGEPGTVYRAEERHDHPGLVSLTLWGAGLVAVVFGTGYLWRTRKRA